MLDYRLWREANEILVSGDGINLLKSKFEEMAARGAPTEYNYYGFNKTDWEGYKSIISDVRYHYKAVPASLVNRMLNILLHYKNTQLLDYNDISTKVQQDFAKASGATHGHDKIIVFTNEPKEYGKIKVFIPHGVERGEIIEINKMIDNYINEFNKTAPPEKQIVRAPDAYGNNAYPRFKFFQRSKDTPNTYWIHPTILNQIVDYLKNKRKIEVEQGTIQASPQVQQPQPTVIPAQDTLKDVEVVGLEEDKIVFRLNIPIQKKKEIFTIFKSFGDKVISYKEGKFYVTTKSYALYKKVRDELDKHGIDATHLDEFVKQNKIFNVSPLEGKSQHEKDVQFFDMEGDAMKIKFPYFHLDKDRKEFLKQLITYTFPDSVYTHSPEFSWTVKGNYKQYVILGQLLKKFGYNVDHLRDILRHKIDDGRILQTRYEGQLPPNFTESIDNRLPDSKLDFYDDQKEGIAFLYSRDHAILGDETGFGKCLAPNSLVSTSCGCFSLEELWNKYAKRIVSGDNFDEWAFLEKPLYVHSIDESGKVVKGEVVSLYREKVKTRLRKVKTGKGKVITTTYPHRFLTPLGWSKDIKVGDWVGSSSNQFALEQKDCDIHLAEFLGWQISDHNKRAQNSKIKDIYDSLGFNFIMLANNNVVKAFLKAFMGNKTEFYSTNRKFIYQLASLIQRFDISVKFGQKHKKYKLSIEDHHDNDLQYEKVISVESVEYDGYVYDLCVNKYENYIAENLVCHNTAQLIAAADLKSKDIYKGKPILIFALKDTKEQWVEQIKTVMGDNEEISTDPLHPRHWTIVSYGMMSKGNNIDAYVNSLKNAGFGIVMFDELHKLKHASSKRSQNVATIVQNIPTRWGASATVSSNKPMDVRNQLAVTGHHFGRISEGKFKRDFAGQRATGYKGAYEDSDFERQVEAAENLNKWLNLSGVYVRRGKSELRKMPKLNITDERATYNPGEFAKLYNNRIQQYKNPKLPVSKLIAARESISQLKTDDTTKAVSRIVNDNKDNPASNYAASKVVVFTNFINSAQQLVQKINHNLKQINPNFKVITYLADTKKSDREKVKSLFTDDPNAKVLVMSMKMGGTGIDLPNAAQSMVVNDFDWTPESAEQSEGRIYRINTNHPVNIDYMVADGLDKKLFDKVKKKRELAAVVQKYRKEYQSTENNQAALDKLVHLQKEMKDIDDEMADIVNSEIEGAGFDEWCEEEEIDIHEICGKIGEL